MLEQSYTVYAIAALAVILIPAITCITCQYPKIILQQHQHDCAEFLQATAPTHEPEHLFDYKNARYPRHTTLPPVFAYLPLIGFCYGITTADKKNQYYFLLLELLLITVAYQAFTSHLAPHVSIPHTIFYLALLVMAAIDFRSHLLPDTIVIPTMWLGLALSAMSLNISYPLAIWGAILGYTIPWLIAKLSQRVTKNNGMGHGDFKMIAMLGAWLGPLDLLGCVFMASCIFILTFVTLATAKKITWKTPVAFGPFLALAAVISLNTNLFALWPLSTLFQL